MKHLVSKLLLLAAAGLGTIPADNCLLMLAGGCCEDSHISKIECHLHEHSAATDCATETDSRSDHHHQNCVRISPDAVTAQIQHVAPLDLFHEIAPLVVADLQQKSTATIAPTRFDPQTRSAHADPPLFLLGRSFLI